MNDIEWLKLLAEFQRVAQLDAPDIARWRREQSPVRYPGDGVLIEHEEGTAVFTVTETIRGVSTRRVNRV